MISVVISSKGDNYLYNDKMDIITNGRHYVPTWGQMRAPDFLYTNQGSMEKALRIYRDLK
jgi:hypothetical protein